MLNRTFCFSEISFLTKDTFADIVGHLDGHDRPLKVTLRHRAHEEQVYLLHRNFALKVT